MTLSPQKADFEKVWGTLSAGIGKVLTLTSVVGMPMVEDIYKLCTAQPQPHSEQLYFRMKKFLEDHVDQLRENMLATQSDLLSTYLKCWDKYSIGSEFSHSIFRYLNMNWIRKRLEDSKNKLGSVYQTSAASEIYEIASLALVTWKERLFMKVKDRLMRSVEELITKDRDGEQIVTSQVSGLVQCLIKLGNINKTKQLELYKEEFEAAYLENTRDYYARESAAYIAANGVSAYMIKAEQRLDEEKARAHKFLDPSSFDKVRKECDTVLIERHKDLMQVECENYLRDNKQDDLSRMFHLLSRIDEGIKPMLEVLQQYVTTTGFDAIKAVPEKDRADPKVYVETILSTYLTFSELVRKAFDNSPAFVAALDKACRRIVNENSVNKNSTKSPELLAKYCDFLLKKGNKNLEENELEEKLNHIIILFKYVDDKDVFQKFYSKMLARRLIHGASVSDDAEGVMISGLKQACGFEYTSKLQRMFTDMTLSSDINEKFKEHLSTTGTSFGKVDFSILVLTAGSWPLQAQSSSFNVPQELEKCVNLFQAYYNTQHQGRKLNWLHHLSKGELRSGYLKKPYEFQVTNYQLGVLLVYNSANTDNLTLDGDIHKSTNLKDADLTRTIESLVDAKILKMSGATGDATTYEPNTEFSLNHAFMSKRLKIKVASSMQKETKQQTDETYKGIDEDRKLYLQAAIVRIMKTRKTLTHVGLIQEVIEQARARFTPSVPMIKKCVEQLIEKEYLARVEGESDKILVLTRKPGSENKNCLEKPMIAVSMPSSV